METLSRTTSGESVRSWKHGLSSASSTSLTRKGRGSIPDVTSGDVERASISMPPPASYPAGRSLPIRTPSKDFIHAPPPLPPTPEQAQYASENVVEDGTEVTPTLEGAQGEQRASATQLPGPAALGLRPTEDDTESNRMSFSSLYSLGSQVIGNFRGTTASTSGPSSIAGSDADGKPESPSLGTTTTTSPLAVTTSNQRGLLETSQAHHFTGRELAEQYGLSLGHEHHQKHPNAPTSSQQGGSWPGQPQPPRRSRSRTSNSRRISGSTGASSASPGSRDGKMANVIGTIGVCALDAKARSKPSRNILNRLISKGEFEVIIFGDKVILDEDVENWPVCDFLISFFSDGFPLDKAIAYASLRKPFCVNDLPMQTVLWDRRICLRILDNMKVPTPERLEVSRDGGPVLPSAEVARVLKERTGVKLDGNAEGTVAGTPPPKQIELSDDGEVLTVDGKTLRKPFVEKPVSGEDHNINIYFSKNEGGGGRRLFRKINNKSSEHDNSLHTPRAISQPDSSYIYEQFLHVENAEDVKAYTVGTEFCHAETRKSPVVDGIVKRNPSGKEIRYITSLTKEEAGFAARIAEGFGQRVCGFDLLRTGEGKSYVIDVNGWSFVKDNNEYYDRTAKILKEMFIKEKGRRDGPRSVSQTEQRPAEPEVPLRKNTSSHRLSSGLHAILKSPSMSRLAGHHHSSARTHSSPEALPAVPLTSPPTFEKTPLAQAPLIPEGGLPPPAVPETSSDTSTRPSVSEPRTPIPPPASKAQWKLKGIVSVIRHADRTPKQKFKFTFHTKPFVDLLKGHQEEVLLIGEAALNSVLEAVKVASNEGIEDKKKLQLLRTTLVRKGSWPGTKVQIKPLFRKEKSEDVPKTPDAAPPKVHEPVATRPEMTPELAPVPEHAATDSPGPERKGSKDSHSNEEGTIEWQQKRSDSLSGMTMSRIAAAENNLVLDKLQLIVKWGGEPTHSARYQAQDLGENLRNDLLLLNRECLDDCSIYSSSERRVTTSAQIFGAAFLDQKDLPPDSISIRKDLLDDSNAAKDEMDRVKKKLKTLLREGTKAPPQFAWPDNMPTPYLAVRQVVELMKFHRKVMHYNFKKLQTGAVTWLNAIANPTTALNDNEKMPSAMQSAMSQASIGANIQARWCTGEDAELFKERWEKLFQEFCDAEKVDPSKCSELYDTMKFDALHNRQFLEWVFTPDQSLLDNEAPNATNAAPPAPSDWKPINQSYPPSPSESPPSSTTGETSKRDNIAQRIGFRRRSEVAGVPQAQKAAATTDSTSTSSETYNSYFSLWKGSGSSKAKLDARLVKLRELYRLSKVLFDYIGPQEYGITDAEKLEIGLLTSLPLLKEIVQDLEDVQASAYGKSFFYFTKESHIYTLLNCILEGGIKTKIERSKIPELDYLSQICFELYESENATQEDQMRSFNYSIRITISPGCHTFDPLDVQLDSKHCIGFAPRRSLTAHHPWKEVLETLRAKFHTVKLPKSFTAVNLSEKIPQEFGQTPQGDDEEKEKAELLPTSLIAEDGVVGSAEEDKVGRGLLGGLGREKPNEDDDPIAQPETEMQETTD